MADIKIEDVTSGQVDGDGVFDKLMTSVNSLLDDQYKKNRITGTDYSNVYLGSMQSAMGQAIQFVLNEQQADKQADLIAKQIIATNEQINASIADTDIKKAQSNKDLLLKDEQILQMKAQVKLVEEQVETEEFQNGPDGLLARQRLDIISATDARNRETDVKINLMKEQIEKAKVEQALIDQKAATEEAQTLDTLTYGSTPGPIAGLVDKQKSLLQKQTDGFDRDAEQKATKIVMDSYTIRRSTIAEEPPPSRADNLDINKFIEKMADGAGVSLTQETWKIYVTIEGLDVSAGHSIILQNNSKDNLIIDANGTFAFSQGISNDPDYGNTYDVSVFSTAGAPGVITPITIVNNSGTISATNPVDITNITITLSY